MNTELIVTMRELLSVLSIIGAGETGAIFEVSGKDTLVFTSSSAKGEDSRQIAFVGCMVFLPLQERACRRGFLRVQAVSLKTTYEVTLVLTPSGAGYLERLEFLCGEVLKGVAKSKALRFCDLSTTEESIIPMEELQDALEALLAARKIEQYPHGGHTWYRLPTGVFA